MSTVNNDTRNTGNTGQQGPKTNGAEMQNTFIQLMVAQIKNQDPTKPVASAIRCSCERFVCRLPALLQLCFSDGTPFADAQTQAWISGADQRDAASPSTPEYSGLVTEGWERPSIFPAAVTLPADITAGFHRDLGAAVGHGPGSSAA